MKEDVIRFVKNGVLQYLTGEIIKMMQKFFFLINKDFSKGIKTTSIPH